MQHRLIRTSGRVRRAQEGRSVWNAQLRLWHGFGLFVFVLIFVLAVDVFDVKNVQWNESTALALLARSTTQQPPPSSTSTAATSATSRRTGTTSSTTSRRTSVSATTRQTSAVAASTKRETTAAWVAPTFSHDVFDTCPLPDRDPWDNEVKKFLEPGHDWFKNCNRTTKVYTKWDERNGTSIVWNDGEEEGLAEMRNSSDCKQRCVNLKTVYEVELDEWKPVEPTIELNCEVVEIMCNSTLHANETTYRYLHQRLVPRTDLPPVPKEWRPHVVLFVVDSVSQTQAERQLVSTLRYLRRDHDVISFPWFNKVALNSRVNALPLLFGELVTPVKRDLFGLPDLKLRMDEPTSCSQPLNNHTNSIFRLFEEAGYRTMSAEDWTLGALYYPGCKGIVGLQSQHYFKAFIRRADNDAELRRRMYDKQCRAMYHDALDYATIFMRAYKDQPQFVHLWLTDASHDYFNRLYRADREIVQWMETHRQILDDAFIIFMGDHGLRVGSIASTRLGKIENNNPMLHIGIPRRLRERPESAFVWNLGLNSERIITAFDLHATLRDIVEFLPRSNFTNTTFDEHMPLNTPPNVLAHSLFRPIPQNEVRNCKTLPVPFDFCLCSYTSTNVTSKNTIRMVGETITQHLNDFLESHNATNLCAKLIYDAVTDIVEYEPTGSGVYQATVRVLPSNGLFQTRIAIRDEGKRIFGATSFERIDKYGKQSHCVQDETRHVCYCRKQLPE